MSNHNLIQNFVNIRLSSKKFFFRFTLSSRCVHISKSWTILAFMSQFFFRKRVKIKWKLYLHISLNWKSSISIQPKVITQRTCKIRKKLLSYINKSSIVTKSKIFWRFLRTKVLINLLHRWTINSIFSNILWRRTNSSSYQYSLKISKSINKRNNSRRYWLICTCFRNLRHL